MRVLVTQLLTSSFNSGKLSIVHYTLRCWIHSWRLKSLVIAIPAGECLDGHATAFAAPMTL